MHPTLRQRRHLSLLALAATLTCFLTLTTPLQTDTETGEGVVHTLDEHHAPSDETLFPSSWKTSTAALDALRKIESESPLRNFHEATHVLYDLRSFIGERRAKYLEIGSYTGVSASLMLDHPYPTHVTAVDPCVCPQHISTAMIPKPRLSRNDSLHTHLKAVE